MEMHPWFVDGIIQNNNKRIMQVKVRVDRRERCTKPPVATLKINKCAVSYIVITLNIGQIVIIGRIGSIKIGCPL